jgi:hypothetical protein
VKHLKTYESKLKGYPTLSRRKHLKGKVEMLVDKYASWYDLLNKKSAIYRGVMHKDQRKVNQNVYIINPSEHSRMSIDTDNIYTLIMDNSENWKDYPKRSKSIICTTSESYASDFGEVYRVIPLKENALFGRCDEADIFQCFWNLKYINDNIDSPRDLEEYLGNTFNMPHGTITDYSELKKIFTKENLDFDLGRKEGETFSGMTIEEFEEIVEKHGSYLAYLDDLMSPANNGFELFNYSQENAPSWLEKEHASYEVWTDSPCLLVRESYIKYYVR